jgi:hypothetical protein
MVPDRKFDGAPVRLACGGARRVLMRANTDRINGDQLVRSASTGRPPARTAASTAAWRPSVDHADDVLRPIAMHQVRPEHPPRRTSRRTSRHRSGIITWEAPRALGDDAQRADEHARGSAHASQSNVESPRGAARNTHGVRDGLEVGRYRAGRAQFGSPIFR